MYSWQDVYVVDASDYLGHLIRHLLNASEAFPMECFLQFWEQVKVCWAHVRTVRRVGKHLPSILFQNFRYCTLSHEATCYHAKLGHRPWTWRTLFGKSLDAKHLAETFCSMPLLQWTLEALCCYHSILVISHNHNELNFWLLAATFFRARRSCRLPLTGLRFQLWFKISYPCFIYGNNSVQKLLTFGLVAPQQFICDPLASCFLFFTQLMRSPLCSGFSLLHCLSHDSENRRSWHICFMQNFVTRFAPICFQQGADDNNRCVVRCCYWLPASWVVLDAYPTFTETDAHRDTVFWSTTLSPQSSCKALWISVGFFPCKVSILMYDRWSLCEIWLQSASSSISRLRFAEQGPHSLPIRTRSLLQSGSQLSQKSEWLHHPTGRASTVCRTFEMTYITSKLITNTK